DATAERLRSDAADCPRKPKNENPDAFLLQRSRPGAGIARFGSVRLSGQTISRERVGAGHTRGSTGPAVSQSFARESVGAASVTGDFGRARDHRARAFDAAGTRSFATDRPGLREQTDR